MKPIETSRLILRDFTMNDAKDLHEIFGDHETMKHCEPAYDFEKTKDFLKSFCIDRRGAIAAVDKQHQKVMGYILFNEFDPGVYEMGWIFNRSHWRQGYAYEACKAVIDAAFRDLHAHKIFAEAIDAVKSVSLMKKLGMTLEGIQRSQTLDGDGHWADLHFYGLLMEDWLINSKSHTNSAIKRY